MLLFVSILEVTNETIRIRNSVNGSRDLDPSQTITDPKQWKNQSLLCRQFLLHSQQYASIRFNIQQSPHLYTFKGAQESIPSLAGGGGLRRFFNECECNEESEINLVVAIYIYI
jgi:hypothetical protein